MTFRIHDHDGHRRQHLGQIGQRAEGANGVESLTQLQAVLNKQWPRPKRPRYIRFVCNGMSGGSHYRLAPTQVGIFLNDTPVAAQYHSASPGYIGPLWTAIIGQQLFDGTPLGIGEVMRSEYTNHSDIDGEYFVVDLQGDYVSFNKVTMNGAYPQSSAGPMLIETSFDLVDWEGIGTINYLASGLSQAVLQWQAPVIPSGPNVARWLVVEVGPQLADTYAALTELDFYDENDNSISWTPNPAAVYDEAWLAGYGSPVPNYWDSDGSWNETNLVDGATGYGSANTTLVSAPNPGTARTRFVVDFGSEKTVTRVGLAQGQNAIDRMPEFVAIYSASADPTALIPAGIDPSWTLLTRFTSLDGNLASKDVVIDPTSHEGVVGFAGPSYGSANDTNVGITIGFPAGVLRRIQLNPWGDGGTEPNYTLWILDGSGEVISQETITGSQIPDLGHSYQSFSYQFDGEWVIPAGGGIAIKGPGGFLLQNAAFHAGYTGAYLTSGPLTVGQTPTLGNTYAINAKFVFSGLPGSLTFGDEALNALTDDHTGPTAASGTVSASSEHNAGQAAWYAFNKSIFTWWSATADGDNDGDWLQYQFTTPKSIARCGFNPGSSLTYPPDDFAIEGSNDGVNWTVVDEIRKPTFTTNTEKLFDFPYIGTFTYYRLITLTHNGVSALRVAEMEYYGE
jgi:hypothetical protein